MHDHLLRVSDRLWPVTPQCNEIVARRYLALQRRINLPMGKFHGAL